MIMSVQSEKNAEIIHHLADINQSDSLLPQRFILMGSLARGVLLGSDVAQLNDPKGRRFRDVDVIDRTTLLQRQYRFLDGTLDAQALKVVRPTELGSSTWGFYDIFEPIHRQAPPLSTFSEASLGLTDMEFSGELYPNEHIAIPSPIAILALSNFFAYAYEMPKHAVQINALKELAPTYKESEIGEARDRYIAAMEKRYPLSLYGKVRKKFFSFAPSIAMSVQKNTLGKIIHFVRGVSVPEDLSLTLEDIQNTTAQK